MPPTTSAPRMSIERSSGTCARPAFRTSSAAPTPSSTTPAWSATPRISICSCAAPTGRASPRRWRRRACAANWCSRTGSEKRFENGHFVDLIFAGGNGLVEVDDDWLAHGVPSVVLEVPVHLVAGRGDDLVEVVRHGARAVRRRATSRTSCASPAPSLDWVRLLRRFDRHAPVLLAHLVLFQFVYPDASRQRPRLGDGRAVAPCSADESLPATVVPGHAAVARAIPDRYPTSGAIWTPARCRSAA